MSYFRRITLAGSPGLARLVDGKWARYDVEGRLWRADSRIDAEVMFSGEWEEIDETDAVSTIVAWNAARRLPVSA